MSLIITELQTSKYHILIRHTLLIFQVLIFQYHLSSQDMEIPFPQCQLFLLNFSPKYVSWLVNKVNGKIHNFDRKNRSSYYCSK